MRISPLHESEIQSEIDCDAGAALRLAGLRIGETATVRRVRGDDEASFRLMEMGLTPGTLVRLNGVAPLGDPLRITLRGYHLSLRRREAEVVEVDRLS